MSEETIHVLVAMDFSDIIIKSLRAVSPRLHVEQHFPEVPDEAWERVEVLYTMRHYPEPEQAPNLRWIQLHSAGMEHMLDQPIVTETEKIAVTSASGIHATPMAEYGVAMMLAFEFNLPKMLRFQAQHHWPKDAGNIFAPRHLRGRTLGIVGYGSIGRELARLADQIGMNVLAIKRHVMQPAEEGSYTEPGTGDPEGDIPERLYPPEALASMVEECDYLALLTPLTDETEKLVNEDIFKAMRDSAVLINMARGGVVDEDALITALETGQIAGAALDVFEEEPLPESSPLWAFENVIISPHISGNSQRYHERVAALFAENLQRYTERRPLLNKLDREAGY